jgi:hypothetical protein
MVLLPLAYPDIFQSMSITPPRYVSPLANNVFDSCSCCCNLATLTFIGLLCCVLEGSFCMVLLVVVRHCSPELWRVPATMLRINRSRFFRARYLSFMYVNCWELIRVIDARKPDCCMGDTQGADCLGEFAGDAERTLRILFDEAKRKAGCPSSQRNPLSLIASHCSSVRAGSAVLSDMPFQ